MSIATFAKCSCLSSNHHVDVARKQHVLDAKDLLLGSTCTWRYLFSANERAARVRVLVWILLRSLVRSSRSSSVFVRRINLNSVGEIRVHSPFPFLIPSSGWQLRTEDGVEYRFVFLKVYKLISLYWPLVVLNLLKWTSVKRKIRKVILKSKVRRIHCLFPSSIMLLWVNISV